MINTTIHQPEQLKSIADFSPQASTPDAATHTFVAENDAAKTPGLLQASASEESAQLLQKLGQPAAFDEARRNSPAMRVASPTNQAYDELTAAYQFFNDRFFDGTLKECLLTFSRSKKFAGFFSANRFVNAHGARVHEISLNPGLFAVTTAESVLSTLAHEMVHQWQHDFGKISRSGYHNKQWADRMLDIGLCPSSTGMPGGDRVGQKVTHYIVDGGLFQIACAELLATNFGVVWFDRLVVAARGKGTYALGGVDRTKKAPTSTPDDAKTITTESDTKNAENVQLAGPAQETGEPNGVTPTSNPKAMPAPPPMANIQAQLSEDKREQLGLIEPVPRAPRKGTRAKYICPNPSCKLSMWGKPGAKLVDASCNTQMVEMVEDEEGAATCSPANPEPSPKTGVEESATNTPLASSSSTCVLAAATVDP